MSESKTPVRIQRKRMKGWRAPEGAVYVGRPSQWGNPFAVGEAYDAVEEEGGAPVGRYVCRTAAEAVECFREHVEQFPEIAENARRELRGRNLMCWCSLDSACHADVLLEIANG